MPFAFYFILSPLLCVRANAEALWTSPALCILHSAVKVA
jgi:hypothetical protein